jgi:uncharacterized protein YprB with RNaseH-like and TPR domain
MLKQTFCHIPGVGYATEKKLWEMGISSWEQLLDRPDLLTRVSNDEIVTILERSLQSLPDTPSYFADNLKKSEAWRLFPHYREKTAYLDIETTGLGEPFEITTIALYDGEKVYSYVNGRNLESFIDDVERFDILVSYNGICFDIPVIERVFRTKLHQAQIDLRYVLAQLGCRGGLKGCERQMGINRGILDGIDGSFAVLLWREYERTGSEAALETLMAYNIEDTVNLERLMVEGYNRNVEQTPFAQELLLGYPDSPQILYQPDPDIMALFRGQLGLN